MPFPYAYYKEEYNGPLHGTELESPVLYLKTSMNSSLGGDVSVSGKSVIYFDTSAASLDITSFVGLKDGQTLFVYKTSSSNTLTIKSNPTHTYSRVVTSLASDIILPNGYMGGVNFIVRQGNGGVFFLHQVDDSGLFADGTVTLPSVTFGLDPDTGIFRKAANQLAISTAGVERFLVTSTHIQSAINIRVPDGVASLPSLSFNTDTLSGFYNTLSSVNFSGNGIDQIKFFKTGGVQFSNGTFTSDSVFELKSTLGLQGLRSKDLLVSSSYADFTLVPQDGIYSKGNVKTSGQFQGTATSAQYADLAERYESDCNYSEGTIVRIGGSKEITIADGFRAFGIVSSHPGFKMNAEAGSDETHPYVALAGRVLCKVIGVVSKGDPICLSAIPGVGESGMNGPIIGRALEDKTTSEEGLVLVVTRCVI